MIIDDSEEVRCYSLDKGKKNQWNDIIKVTVLLQIITNRPLKQ